MIGHMKTPQLKTSCPLINRATIKVKVSINNIHNSDEPFQVRTTPKTRFFTCKYQCDVFIIQNSKLPAFPFAKTPILEAKHRVNIIVSNITALDQYRIRPWST